MSPTFGVTIGPKLAELRPEIGPKRPQKGLFVATFLPARADTWGSPTHPCQPFPETHKNTGKIVGAARKIVTARRDGPHTPPLGNSGLWRTYRRGPARVAPYTSTRPSADVRRARGTALAAGGGCPAPCVPCAPLKPAKKAINVRCRRRGGQAGRPAAAGPAGEACHCRRRLPPSPRAPPPRP